MKIITKTVGLDLTPTLGIYVDKKLSTLSKFLEKFDAEGEVELFLWLIRTTTHHRKGEVFKAEADLRLPKKILRAEEEAYDLRAAIDAVKDTLRVEIKKYKTRFFEPTRKGMRGQK